jgi:hypothetical protein
VGVLVLIFKKIIYSHFEEITLNTVFLISFGTLIIKSFMSALFEEFFILPTNLDMKSENLLNKMSNLTKDNEDDLLNNESKASKSENDSSQEESASSNINKNETFISESDLKGLSKASLENLREQCYEVLETSISIEELTKAQNQIEAIDDEFENRSDSESNNSNFNNDDISNPSGAATQVFRDISDTHLKKEIEECEKRKANLDPNSEEYNDLTNQQEFRQYVLNERKKYSTQIESFEGESKEPEYTGKGKEVDRGEPKSNSKGKNIDKD